jgi:hypothetical protein
LTLRAARLTDLHGRLTLALSANPTVQPELLRFLRVAAPDGAHFSAILLQGCVLSRRGFLRSRTSGAAGFIQRAPQSRPFALVMAMAMAINSEPRRPVTPILMGAFFVFATAMPCWLA